MVAPAAGEVVLIPFPFSDLSQTQVRPAICPADTGRSNGILGQVTSNPYGDPAAESLDAPDFATGGLLVAGQLRPTGEVVHGQRGADGAVGGTAE